MLFGLQTKNSFSPLTWSKSMQTEGNLPPQSAQGTSLSCAKRALNLEFFSLFNLAIVAIRRGRNLSTRW